MTIADIPLQGRRASGASAGHAADVHVSAVSRPASIRHGIPWRSPAAAHRREAGSTAVSCRGGYSGRRQTAAGKEQHSCMRLACLPQIPAGQTLLSILLMRLCAVRIFLYLRIHMGC